MTLALSYVPPAPTYGPTPMPDATTIPYTPLPEVPPVDAGLADTGFNAMTLGYWGVGFAIIGIALFIVALKYRRRKRA